MSYITWSNWCYLAWGWRAHRHAFDAMIVWPLFAWMVATFIAAGFLEANYRHVPVGARRTLSFLIGGAVASVWPIAVGGLAGAFGAAFLWCTARDTVRWSWETIRDTASWALIKPIKRLRARRAARTLTPKFPTAKVVNR